MNDFKRKIKNPYTWLNIFVMAILTGLSYIHEVPSQINSWTALWEAFLKIVSNPFALFMVLWACYMEFHQLPPDAGIEETENLLENEEQKENKDND